MQYQYVTFPKAFTPAQLMRYRHSDATDRQTDWADRRDIKQPSQNEGGNIKLST
jgi:hypothetical protein